MLQGNVTARPRAQLKLRSRNLPAVEFAFLGFNGKNLYRIIEKVQDHNSIPPLEQLVLTAILTLSEAYGVTIHAKTSELAKPKSSSLGGIYYTLDRLEEKGFVSSWLAGPTAERGYRAKRCYRLEALGERALQESTATAQRIWDSIAEVWGKEWAKEWGKRWGKEAS